MPFKAAKLKGVVLGFLFPQWCVGCGREGDFICPACRRSLPRVMSPLYPRFGKPQSSGMLCPTCVGGQVEIDGIRSPFRFDGVVRQAIHQLKYKNLRALAGTLAELLSEYLAHNPVPGEVLVPVPLHQKRLRERGYNQSTLLARETGKLIGLPVVDDCLIRQRHALPQARTSTVEEDKQVLLIDDVSTSGATLDACAVALKAAGAASVWGLVLAREI